MGNISDCYEGMAKHIRRDRAGIRGTVVCDLVPRVATEILRILRRAPRACSFEMNVAQRRSLIVRTGDGSTEAMPLVDRYHHLRDFGDPQLGKSNFTGRWLASMMAASCCILAGMRRAGAPAVAAVWLCTIRDFHV